MIGDLQKAVDALKVRPEYESILQGLSSELHDIFEALLITALTENPGVPIDGAAILATLMRLFKEVSNPQRPTQPSAPAPLRGLPSEIYGRSNPGS